MDRGLIAFEQGVFGEDERLVFFDPATEKVTPVPGGERGYYARFSEDGSMLVWSRLREDREGTDGVMVHDLRTGKTRKIQEEGGGCPAFAPDGRSVVTSSAERIDLDSGKIDPLPGPKEGCRIELEDGRFLYTHHDDKIQLIDGDKIGTIYRAPGCRLDTASISHEGSNVAFIRRCKATDDFGVTVMGIDGSKPQSAVKGNCYGTGWSPDGKSMVSACVDAGETAASLWVFDLAGSAQPEKVQPSPVNTPTWGTRAPD
ncbi:MAG: hypothetical protein KDB04_02700 [Acidimicrobiales bacterium]|nr:hypothetical protein [Acidimicrobiales bacterium]